MKPSTVEKFKKEFIKAINEGGEEVDGSNRDLIAFNAVDDCMNVVRKYCRQTLREMKSMSDVRERIEKLNVAIK